jgi:hypothetical protein
MTLRTLAVLLPALLFAAPAAAQKQLPRKPQPAPGLPSYVYSGSGNNIRQSLWGSTGIDLLRAAPSAYADGLSSPAGSTRPSARALSNLFSAQTGDEVNNRHLSDYVYVFGQFLDHDIDLTQTGSEKLAISVPTGDPFFDPFSTGTKTMSFSRSAYYPTTGTSSPRQQTNSITAWVDGSQIYGSDSERAAALREGTGGRMKTSTGNMLPFNTAGLANANDSHIMPDNQLFLAGDVRANENPELISLQTLFMREHNRLAGMIAAQHPDWSDEQIFQNARTLNIAQLQAITYNEFLPALLGKRLPGYQGYNPKVNPGIANEFSTAAFRFGHSLLDGEIARMNPDGSDTPQGDIALRDAFFNSGVFNPALPSHQGDIDPFLMSASRGNAQEVDLHLVDDVRNFLFGPPGSGGFDLASLNIQRGRDHGLADYNRTRAAYGLRPVHTWADITKDTELQGKLQSAYGSVDNVDLWVGGLAEDHLPGSSLGPTFQRIISDQFMRLRDGDRLWYENILPGDQRRQVSQTRLSDLIKRNTTLNQIQDNVFFWQG